MTMQYPKPCDSCLHYQGERKCAAFDTIPDEIVLFGGPHSSLRGDEDQPVTFTLDPQRAQAFADWSAFRAALLRVR